MKAFCLFYPIPKCLQHLNQTLLFFSHINYFVLAASSLANISVHIKHDHFVASVRLADAKQYKHKSNKLTEQLALQLAVDDDGPTSASATHDHLRAASASSTSSLSCCTHVSRKRRCRSSTAFSATIPKLEQPLERQPYKRNSNYSTGSIVAVAAFASSSNLIGSVALTVL